MYGGGDLEMVMYSFVRRLVAAGVAIAYIFGCMNVNVDVRTKEGGWKCRMGEG